MKLILLGAPGAGKGTQAEIISEKLSIPVISTGNIIRAAMKEETTAGKKAKSFVNSGGLVPDEIVIDMIKERISHQDCENGFILDGFPRTLPQAESLDKMGVIIDYVLNIEVADAVIANRIIGRRMCEVCSATYHLENLPPKTSGRCDKCGGALISRKDDLPETVTQRLRIYHDQTFPLIAYYKKTGKLLVVAGEDSVENTTKQVLAVLGA